MPGADPRGWLVVPRGECQVVNLVECQVGGLGEWLAARAEECPVECPADREGSRGDPVPRTGLKAALGKVQGSAVRQGDLANEVEGPVQ